VAGTRIIPPILSDYLVHVMFHLIIHNDNDNNNKILAYSVIKLNTA